MELDQVDSRSLQAKKVEKQADDTQIESLKVVGILADRTDLLLKVQLKERKTSR